MEDGTTAPGEGPALPHADSLASCGSAGFGQDFFNGQGKIPEAVRSLRSLHSESGMTLRSDSGLSSDSEKAISLGPRALVGTAKVLTATASFAGPQAAAEMLTASTTICHMLTAETGCPQELWSFRAQVSEPSLRIAVIVNGCLGDLQPMIALTRCLVHYRHRVCIFTNANLVPTCWEHGMDALPVFADSQAVLQSIGGVGRSRSEGTQKAGRAASEWLLANPKACSRIDDALIEMKPHAMICGTQASAPCVRHEHRAMVPTIPVFLTREMLQQFEWIANSQPPRPSFFAISQLLDDGELPTVAELRRTEDWPLVEQPAAVDLEAGTLAELRSFLASGPAPVAIGWGSTIAKRAPAPLMLRLALGALQAAGMRGVILGGWARVDEVGRAVAAGDDEALAALDAENSQELATFAASEVCFVSSAPYAWLLPQCCCIVHHGGVGTTHAALRAGRPSVVTPVKADHFAAAEAIRRHSAGFGFDVPLHKVTKEQLASAISQALEAAPHCDELCRRFEAHNGEKRAAALINKFLQEQVVSGRWEQEFHQHSLAARRDDSP
mmetsp:Transcript_60863/g.177903  ORF Transcript_60863/g.177903 Transcript_60863/m.177903 type:complete len:555 (-) Transcript_60863:162-1826(-)